MGRPARASASTPRASRGPGARRQLPGTGGGHRLDRDGLAALSDAFHRLFRSASPAARGATGRGPVLLNNWEGTYFDFDEERIVAIARRSKDLGAELFVLDDGWFGDRDDDHRALGDWFVNRPSCRAG